MKSKSYLKKYFTFSRGERNGIIFLLIIAIILVVAIKLVPDAYSKEETSNFLNYKKEIDSLFVSDTLSNVPQSKTTFLTLPKQVNKPKQKLSIEINSSDSATLTTLPGIGPVFASRIIKYRNLLGGFYHLSQLKEVYGLKDENLSMASSHITINPHLIKGVLIDTAGFKALARHPYIGKDRAWKILNYKKRNISGTFSEEEMKNTNIFDSVQWQRVKPYLIFKN